EHVEAMCSTGACTVVGAANGAAWCVRARKKQNSPTSSSTTNDMPRRAVRMTPKDKLGASNSGYGSPSEENLISTKARAELEYQAGLLSTAARPATDTVVASAQSRPWLGADFTHIIVAR
nr:hypothetical protein [Tanacetum cinerariifolium]